MRVALRGIGKANELRQHYWLEVNAVIRSMIAREDDRPYGTRDR